MQGQSASLCKPHSDGATVPSRSWPTGCAAPCSIESITADLHVFVCRALFVISSPSFRRPGSWTRAGLFGLNHHSSSLSHALLFQLPSSLYCLRCSSFLCCTGPVLHNRAWSGHRSDPSRADSQRAGACTIWALRDRILIHLCCQSGWAYRFCYSSWVLLNMVSTRPAHHCNRNNVHE